METSDWIALVAAILVGGGTLTLAFMTWKSIHQTRSIHERERRERLLNEILDWARDVATCAFSIPAPMMFEDITAGLETPTVEKMVQRARVTTYTNLRLRYQIAARKSKYIENIASSFSGNLDDAVKKLSKQLNNVISALQKCSRDLDDISKTENLKRAEDSLRKKADILVEEAVKIKTRDTG